MSKFGGKKTQKLVKQGANPDALYSAAVTGLTEDMIIQVRRTAACSHEAPPPLALGILLTAAPRSLRAIEQLVQGVCRRLGCRMKG